MPISGRFLLVFLVGALGWGTPIYTATKLTLPGRTYTAARGINDSGQVVGLATNNSGYREAFLYSGGVMTGLGSLLGGGLSVAFDINESGQIVGYTQKAPGPGPRPQEAFLYSSGVLTRLGTISGPNSVANAINDSGQVVGWAQNSSRYTIEAFLYSGGVMTGLGFLHGANCCASFAGGINDSGQVVGASGSEAFLYSGGVMTGLGTLGGFSSSAGDINESGQIVGTSRNSSGYGEAFLYSGGVMMSLNGLVTGLGPGVSLEAGGGINNRGQIVANGSDGYAYLLNPVEGPVVPEPASLGLAGAALAGLFLLRSRGNTR